MNPRDRRGTLRAAAWSALVLVALAAGVAGWRFLRRPTSAADPMAQRLEARLREALARPEDPDAQLRLAEAYLERGEAAPALAPLLAASRHPRTAGAASLLLARVAAVPELAGEAFRAAEGTTRIAPNDPATWEGVVRCLYQMNQRASARSFLEAAYRRFPKLARFRFLEAQMLEQEGRNREAVRLYREALRQQPDPDGYFLLGVLLARMRGMQQARDAFTQAIRLDPKRVAPHLGLARACLDLGLPAEAERAARAALSLAPEDPEALYILGRVLTESGSQQAGNARRLLEAALERRPTHNDARYYLGILDLREGKARAAVRNLEAVVAAQPDRIDARQNYAKALRLAGDGKAAAAQEALAAQLVQIDARHSRLSNRVSLRPNDPDAHCDLGDFYLEHGVLPKALREYERALALDPRHARAQAGLRRARGAKP